MNRAIVAGLALLLLTSACGGGDKKAEAASPEPTSPATSTLPAVSLHDSCPEIEAAMPNGFLPPAAKWQSAAEKLAAIAESGDVETQNALEGLQKAVDTLAADPASGQPYVDADRALLAALDDLAKRCKLVGSSALQ